MKTLMNNFVVIIQTMNEKKAVYVETHLDRAVEVQKRINSKNVVAPSQYTLQRRACYVMIQNVQQAPLHHKPRSRSPSVTSSPKRKKLEQGSSSSQKEQYSPSQSPIQIDDEASLRE